MGTILLLKQSIITVSDFRQKHIAAGGEGAPLAVYGDYYLFSKKGENRILLNMGGIANFTFLPGNTGRNYCFYNRHRTGKYAYRCLHASRFYHKPFDENGEIASTGKVNDAFLETLKSLAFFRRHFPKTTGPEVFNFDYVETAHSKIETAFTFSSRHHRYVDQAQRRYYC